MQVLPKLYNFEARKSIEKLVEKKTSGGMLKAIGQNEVPSGR